jgi:hypothetical protein
VEIITQDTARQSHIEVPTYTVQVVPATEAALKKAKKKCWLHEKHVAVNKQTSADTDGTVCTPIATTAPTLGTTAAPVHLAINSTKPNVCSGPTGLNFDNYKKPCLPNYSHSQSLVKNSKKGMKMAYQCDYYHTCTQLPISIQSRVEQTTTKWIEALELNTAAPVPASTPTLISTPVPTHSSTTEATTVITTMTVERRDMTKHKSGESEESTEKGGNNERCRGQEDSERRENAEENRGRRLQTKYAPWDRQQMAAQHASS